jgi:hypothetical protein
MFGTPMNQGNPYAQAMMHPMGGSSQVSGGLGSQPMPTQNPTMGTFSAMNPQSTPTPYSPGQQSGGIHPMTQAGMQGMFAGPAPQFGRWTSPAAGASI